MRGHPYFLFENMSVYWIPKNGIRPFFKLEIPSNISLLTYVSPPSFSLGCISNSPEALFMILGLIIFVFDLPKLELFIELLFFDWGAKLDVASELDFNNELPKVAVLCQSPSHLFSRDTFLTSCDCMNLAGIFISI